MCALFAHPMSEGTSLRPFAQGAKHPSIGDHWYIQDAPTQMQIPPLRCGMT
jgi:hypothetical protein